MICEFGSVVVVPFLFTDLPVTKYRPALVISNVEFNRANGSSLLAMITSARESSWSSDVPITDGTAAGLKVASVVRWKVFTLLNDTIASQAGSLGAADLKAARSALHAMIS